MKLNININDKREVFNYLIQPGNNLNGRLTRENGFKNNFPVLYEEYIKFHTNNEIDDMKFIQKLWYFLQDIYTPIFCKYCGEKITPFNGFKYGHQKYCCISCMNKDDTHKENVNIGILKKYGSFDEYFKIRNEKSEKTCINRYNVTNAGGYVEFVEKGKKTKIEKYGSLENLYKLNKKKQEETLKNKYGSLDRAYKEISTKSIESNRNNHNGLLFSQTEEGKKISSEQVKETNRNNFINSVFKNDEHIVNIDDNNILLCKCYECDCEECDEKVFNIPYHIYIYRKKQNIPICYKKYNRRRQYSKSVSKNEKELLSYIKSIYSGKIIENDRKILDGKEIDIYLPDIKVGFEYNGDFWHCNPKIYDNDYVNPISHKSIEEMKEYDYNKLKLSESKGIKLYFIWESDWLFDEDIKKYIMKCIYER